MNWLSHLSLGQALRWSLLWPAALLAAAAVAALYLRLGAGEWAVAWRFGSSRGVPVWLALGVAGALVLLGPVLTFLGVWGVARR